MANAVFQLMLRLSMVSSLCLQASTQTRSWYLHSSNTSRFNAVDDPLGAWLLVGGRKFAPSC